MKTSKKPFLAICLLTAGMILASCGAGTLLQTIGSGGTIANAFTSVIGMDKVTQRGLVGTWKYNGPGCAFTSENLLAKAGGEVAATKIEQELEPYFQKTGLTAQNTYVTFKEDKTFKACIMKGMLITINCYAKREYGGISLLFESKKLLNVLQVLAAMSGNSTVQKVGELSKNYEGVRLGFDMKQ